MDSYPQYTPLSLLVPTLALSTGIKKHRKGGTKTAGENIANKHFATKKPLFSIDIYCSYYYALSKCSQSEKGTLLSLWKRVFVNFSALPTALHLSTLKLQAGSLSLFFFFSFSFSFNSEKSTFNQTERLSQDCTHQWAIPCRGYISEPTLDLKKIPP